MGRERQSSRAKQGGKRTAEDQGGQPPGGLRGPVAREPRAPRATHAPERGSKSFVLRTYIVGGMGEKTLHIDYLVNVVPAFLGECDYPNLGMCGGLLARILILRRTPFVHLVGIQICDRRQLLKIGALSKVTYGLFL